MRHHSRDLTGKDLAYETISDEWAELVSAYDTRRRVQVLVEDLLGQERIHGRRCLDAGAGLGFFAWAVARHRPERIVAVDIAPSLVAKLGERLPGAECRVADLLDLERGLGAETFDVVVSSEAIEHTPDPQRAVAQLAGRLRPGGHLALSCPNHRWLWALRLAVWIGLRKHYAGHENWVRPAALLAWLREAGLEVVRKEGIHLVPWHVTPKRLLEGLDTALRQWSYGLAVNLAVLARKP